MKNNRCMTSEIENGNTTSLSSSSAAITSPKKSSTSSCSIVRGWQNVTESIHTIICSLIVSLSIFAARKPILTVFTVPILSVLLIFIGLKTNFEVVSDSNVLFGPVQTPTDYHRSWLQEENRFPVPSKPFAILIHDNGNNILKKTHFQKIFEVMNVVKHTTGYEDICAQGDYFNPLTNTKDCYISSITAFWDHNETKFNKEITTDEQLIYTISLSETIPSTGVPVDLDNLLDTATGRTFGLLGQVRAYFVYIFLPILPDDDSVHEFEKEAIQNLFALQDQWTANADVSLTFEINTPISFTEEFKRTLSKDLPLIPLVVAVMSVFTCFVFFKANATQSRTMLGIGSVVTIVFSIMSGYGVMFIIGVPYTGLTTILPFVVFGIGLDDTFIITGHYFRLAEKKHNEKDTRRNISHQRGRGEGETIRNNDDNNHERVVIQRITETMKTAGISIFVTTLTTSLAFVLGLISNVPAVYWLCMYAFPMIIIDFIYQITFFIALLVLDERRVQSNRFDFCLCCFQTSSSKSDPEQLILASASASSSSSHSTTCPPDACMVVVTAAVGKERIKEKAEDGIYYEDSEDGSAEEELKSYYQELKKYYEEQEFDSPNESDDSKDGCDHESNCNRISNEALKKSYELFHKSMSVQRPSSNVVSDDYGGSRDANVVVGSAKSDDYHTSSISTKDESEGKNTNSTANKDNQSTTNNNNKSLSDRVMYWYSERLMIPQAKVLVLVMFAGLFGLCMYSTTLMKQEFNVTDMLAEDSYVTRYANLFMEYSPRKFPVDVYFRNVDQSKEAIQNQMSDYLDELSSLSYFGQREAQFCWIKDYKLIMNDEKYTPYFQNKTFTEQIDILLNLPTIKDIYKPNIIRDETTGEIIASRCQLYVYNLGFEIVQEQIDFFQTQRDVTKSQPINQKLSDDHWSFFTYKDIYHIFEFYSVHIHELISTAAAGLLAVTFVSLFFVKDWSAIFIITPLMAVLYIDLIGIIQFCGIKMNIITYISLVISMGLLIDFTMHVLFSYYESKEKTREGKVKDALQTVGSSILVGGLSTFLGVLPLAGSVSTVLQTIYICFFAMIVLGISHGLILLPVLLSIFGRTDFENNDPTEDDIRDEDGMKEGQRKNIYQSKKCRLTTVLSFGSLDTSLGTSIGMSSEYQ